MKLLVFSLFFNCSALKAREYSENELLDIGRSAFEKRASAKGADEAKAIFRDALNGLSDAQKIRAIAYRVLAFDENPKYTMKSSNSMVAAFALGQDQELIADWSELRDMLKEAKDPREFFLISGLIPWSSDERKHDFVGEFALMLFADGRVAKDEGEYTKYYAGDVSEYAYDAILISLRALGADFEPPAEKLPHEQQALILAKWLKRKWPGCENLEIPVHLSSKEQRPGKKNQAAEIPVFPTAKNLKDTPSSTSVSGPRTEKRHWPWIIGGSLFLSLLVLLTRVVKNR